MTLNLSSQAVGTMQRLYNLFTKSNVISAYREVFEMSNDSDAISTANDIEVVILHLRSKIFNSIAVSMRSTVWLLGRRFL